MKTFDVKSEQAQNDVRLVIVTQSQLHDLIVAAVGAALQDPEFLKSCEGGEVYNMLSRQAAADRIGVSLATMDRIARHFPDLIPKRRHANGKPYFLRSDVQRYMQFKGINA